MVRNGTAGGSPPPSSGKRAVEPIRSAAVLADLIFEAVPGNYRHGRIHPATRTFQAIRIEVNGELDRLKKTLENAVNVMNIGGRIGIITFHSLEDRIVKRYFKDLNRSCICPPRSTPLYLRGCPCTGYSDKKTGCSHGGRG